MGGACSSSQKRRYVPEGATSPVRKPDVAPEKITLDGDKNGEPHIMGDIGGNQSSDVKNFPSEAKTVNTNDTWRSPKQGKSPGGSAGSPGGQGGQGEAGDRVRSGNNSPAGGGPCEAGGAMSATRTPATRSYRDGGGSAVRESAALKDTQSVFKNIQSTLKDGDAMAKTPTWADRKNSEHSGSIHDLRKNSSPAGFTKTPGTLNKTTNSFAMGSTMNSTFNKTSSGSTATFRDSSNPRERDPSAPPDVDKRFRSFDIISQLDTKRESSPSPWAPPPFTSKRSSSNPKQRSADELNDPYGAYYARKNPTAEDSEGVRGQNTNSRSFGEPVPSIQSKINAQQQKNGIGGDPDDEKSIHGKLLYYGVEYSLARKIDENLKANNAIMEIPTSKEVNSSISFLWQCVEFAGLNKGEEDMVLNRLSSLLQEDEFKRLTKRQRLRAQSLTGMKFAEEEKGMSFPISPSGRGINCPRSPSCNAPDPCNCPPHNPNFFSNPPLYMPNMQRTPVYAYG